ncbi:unnamed protein product, partial [Ixodes persulcatus]
MRHCVLLQCVLFILASMRNNVGASHAALLVPPASPQSACRGEE